MSSVTRFWILALVVIAILPSAASGPPVISQQALNQIVAMQQEKASWTPAQCKIQSKLLLAAKRSSGEQLASGLPTFRSSIRIDSANMVLVDIQADVSQSLLGLIQELGGEVISSFEQYQAIRARMPIRQIEALAEEPAVKSIRPADVMMTAKTNTSEGDVAHRAINARSTFGINGTGVKVGVLSDSVDSLATLQASGDLPAGVTVLSGQSGNPGTSEGTAMLEIVYDLAPGASLYYATADGGQATFASNIQALQAAGCKVIIDDVGYLAEAAFQDGIIAQAVESVSAAGSLYFSAAGNEGSKDKNTSGVWEGDFVGTAPPPVLASTGTANSFNGSNSDQITVDPPSLITLQWSDPMGASANDYDLYLLDSTLSTVFDVSTGVQSGTQDPLEAIDSTGFNDTSNRLVVVLFSGAARYLRLNTHRGRLSVNTSGQNYGHAAAASAFSVAAVSVSTAGGGAFTGGSGNPDETYSTDGLRRVFYLANGTPITPGNFSSTGGAVRQKPDIAAADCVSTATPGFLPFCGTSAAAPHAGAIAALLLSFKPALTTSQAREALTLSALDNELPGVDRDSGYGIVDAVAAISYSANPAVISSDNRQTPAGQFTNGSSVTWRVIFNKPVTGVDTTDFTLTKVSGAISGYSLSSVSPVNSTTYNVTANTGSGGGELRLDVLAAAVILDSFGNDYNANFTSGQTYIVDKTPPTTTANPVGSVYSSDQNVSLTPNETATVYYTTDGSTPSTSSPQYSTPIPISVTTTLRFFARDTAGNDESPTKQEVYTIDKGPDNIATVRGAPASGLTLRGIVTAKFADCFYVESSDMSSGARVNATPAAVVGDRVWFVGYTTLANGQKQIATSTVIVLSHNSPLPYVGMRTRDFGGHDYGANDPGVTNGLGALNVGLLVDIHGIVTYRDTSVTPAFFYIWDGANRTDSPVNDGNAAGAWGIRVRHSGLINSTGVVPWTDWVEVKGIVSVNQTAVGGRTISEILPAETPTRLLPGDFTTVNSPAGVVVAGSNSVGVPYTPGNVGDGDPSGFGQPYEPAQVIAPGKTQGEIDYRLTRWDSVRRGSLIYDMSQEPHGPFGGIILGDGYWLNAPAAWTVSYKARVQNIPQWISPGTSFRVLLSCPQNHDVRLDPVSYGQDFHTGLMMTDGAQVLSFLNASEFGAGWIESTGIFWDNVGRGSRDVGVSADGAFDDTLHPWLGYWFLWHQNYKSMIVP